MQLYYSSTQQRRLAAGARARRLGQRRERGRFGLCRRTADGLYEFATRAEDVLGNRETGPFVAQTSTIYDTTKPSSEVTWTPEYETGDTITGTWEAVPSQAPITRSTLWVRLEISEALPGAWTAVETFVIRARAGTVAGTFEHDALEDGTYYFATVAHDAAGKVEPEPHGEGDAHTIRDSEIGAPIDVMLVQSQEWSQENDFEVVWTNPEDLSGIVAATYQLYPESGPPLDPVREYVNDPPEIEDIHVPAEGRYTLWLWLEDRRGQRGHSRLPRCRRRCSSRIGRSPRRSR